jgi:hypothetical protein
VLVYRVVSVSVAIFIYSFVRPLLVGSLSFLSVGQETAAVIAGVCVAVVVERWQEPRLATKSKRTNVILALAVTVLASNPLRITIDPQLVPADGSTKRSSSMP